MLFVGNFSTKILSILLVPLYAIYFEPDDFGEINLYLTFLSMAYVIFSFQSVESNFRFINDAKDKDTQKRVMTNSFIISLSGILLYIILFLIAKNFYEFKYSIFLLLFVSSTIIINLLLHAIRGLGYTKIYVSYSVFLSVLISSFTLLWLLLFDASVEVLIEIPVYANIILIFFIIRKTKLFEIFSFDHIDIIEIKNQLRFSLPLIPNALSIWLLSSLGILMVSHLFGLYYSGLVQYSLKFPILLGTLTSIFHMAWQMSVISQKKSIERNNFATKVFKNYLILNLLIFCNSLPIFKFLFFEIIDGKYLNGWIYIPFFMLGMMFKAFAEFYDVGFYSAKKTSALFKYTLLSMLIYLCLGYILGIYMGVIGISVAYSLSELIRWFVIKKQVKRYLDITLKKKDLLYIIVFCTLSTFIYYKASLIFEFLYILIVNLIIYFIYKYEINYLISTFYRAISKKIKVF